jgi:hypothetical protein
LFNFQPISVDPGDMIQAPMPDDVRVRRMAVRAAQLHLRVAQRGNQYWLEDVHGLEPPVAFEGSGWPLTLSQLEAGMARLEAEHVCNCRAALDPVT